MGITLWSFSGLFSPLQQLVGWLAGASMRRPPQPAFAPAGAAPRRDERQGRAHGSRMPATLTPAVSRRPLRVLRVVDRGQPAANAGRMVISGRMADVCAELDRLTAAEARRSVAGRP